MKTLTDTAVINYDTLAAYLSKKYPNRQAPSIEPRDTSDLVRQLKKAGILDIKDLDERLTRSSERFILDENENPPVSEAEDGEPTVYTATGAVRVSLKLDWVDLFKDPFEKKALKKRVITKRRPPLNTIKKA